MTNDNKEKYEPTEDCHIFIAKERSKENKGMANRKVHRKIIRDYNRDLDFLRAICTREGGKWRIYRTVNKRSFAKGNKLFQHRLIDDYDTYYYRLDSLWKTCLIKPSSKVEKKFLLDVDTKDFEKMNVLFQTMYTENIQEIETIESPNGYHIIVEPFDVRKLEHLDFVTVLKDGYIYIDKIENDT